MINFPNGKQLQPFQPSVQPLSPPLKSGPTVPHTTTISYPPKQEIHQAASTAATVTMKGVPIAETYTPIPALKIYEGKQRFVCFNCKSDTPSRHYYLQCQQLCQFQKCYK